MKNKHAFLIICHKNKKQILLLLKTLDNERNDIYILIDRNSKLSTNDFKNSTKRTRLKIFKKNKIVWGDYSIVESTLFLLKQATVSCHDYYHLISGQCLPIKPMNEFFAFFDKNLGTEYIETAVFVDYKNLSIKENESYRRYHFFTKMLGKYWDQKQNTKIRQFSIKVLANMYLTLLNLQRKLHIYRNKKINIYKGGQWFSITHNLALFLIDNNKLIKKNYRFTYGADESFVQTFSMMSPYKHNIYNDNLRLIEWSANDSSPRILTVSDYKKIINSTKLFARKFDETVDQKIIEKIVSHVSK